MLKNERGAVHIVSLLIFVLALFGAWFLYSSYQQKGLQANVTEAVKGYRQVIENAIKNPQDRNVAHQYLQQVQDIIERNQSRLQNR